MSRILLIKTITETAMPVLVARGFVATNDLAWTRHRSHFVHCIEFQLRSDGDVYCANLGVHMDFLPGFVSQCIVSSSGFVQADCEIKERLAPIGESDHWWTVGDELQTLSMLACLNERGFPFFEQFTSLLGPFGAIAPETVGDDSVIALLPNMTKVRRILLLARIHEYLGDSEQALKWAKFGMDNIGISVGPKAAFREIIRKIGN